MYGEVDFWSFYDIMRAASKNLPPATNVANDCMAPASTVRGFQRSNSDGGGDAHHHSSTEAPKPGISKDAKAVCGHQAGLKFYDLGSGCGKAIFTAVLAVDFRWVVSRMSTFRPWSAIVGPSMFFVRIGLQRANLDHTGFHTLPRGKEICKKVLITVFLVQGVT